MFGSPEETAKLLLPPGSVVLGASTYTTVLPARDTMIGTLAPPPKNYYQ